MLDQRAKKFCEEYIKDFNKERAAQRAGYAKSRAGETAERLLQRSEVLERICALQEEIIEAGLFKNKNRVIKEYWDMYEKAMQAQPVKVWDKELKEYVETGEYTFDDKVAMKCLECIAKLGGMFSEKEAEKPAESNFELVVRVEKDEENS